MSLITRMASRLFGGQKAKELTYDQLAGLIDGATGGQVAGVTVTDKTALQVSTVLACVRVIADGCATPDLSILREKPDGGSEIARKRPEYRLLCSRPNEWQTSFEWRRQMTLHAALTGEALSYKVRDDRGRVRELIPVKPGCWDVRRISRYEVRYRCWDDYGLIGEFTRDDVFVIKNLQWDWLKSMNAVALARQAVGLAMASEQSAAALQKNSLRPSGVYSVEGTLSDTQHAQLTSWIERYIGTANAGKPLVLDRNAKWVSTSGLSAVDAQAVEMRRLQIEEICRAFGVFPLLAMHSDKTATFASSEAFFRNHLIQTLTPWHKEWCSQIDEFLLDGDGPLYAHFDTRYLVAGSMKDRAVWARTMAELGIYTRNELREEEGRDPLPGLDEPLTPLNMTQGPQDDPPEPPEPQD